MPNAHELLARPPCLGAEFNKDGSRRGSPKAFKDNGKGRSVVDCWSDPRALGLSQGEATMQLAQPIKRETRTQDGRRARIFDDKGKVAPYGVSYLGGLQAFHNVNCDMLAVYPQPAHQRDNGLKRLKHDGKDMFWV